MNRKVFLILILILVLSVSKAGAVGPPERVDIYPQGIDVTWVFKAEPEVIIELPSSFDVDRIGYKVSEGAKVMDFESVYELTDSWIPPAFTELYQKIQQTEKVLKEIAVKLKSIEQTIAYLSDTNIGLKLENPLNYFREAQELRVSLEQELQDITLEKVQKEKELRLLKQQLSQGYGGDIERVLIIRLVTNGVGFIELTCYSPYANWEPFYRASLDSTENLVRLDSFIRAGQRTGLNYEGMILTHTVQPLQQVGIPQLSPMVARITQPESLTLGRAQMGVPALLQAEVKSDSVGGMTQIQSFAGVSYVGEGKLPSNNQSTLINAATEEIPVKVLPKLVPLQEEQAWLLVETDTPLAPLLLGEAEFIVDGYLTGRGRLSHAGGDESLSLAFGRSPLVRATKTPMVYTERLTWLGRHVRRDGYHIEVTNGMAQSVDVEVMDRVPIAGHDKIKITRRISHSPDQEHEGVLTWKLHLEPGESKTISVEYEIEYPDNMELQVY